MKAIDRHACRSRCAKLLGAWKLVTWQQIRQDGTIDYPLGPDAIGQLMYSDSDRVSAQLVRVDQPPFASDDGSGQAARR